MEKVCVIGAGSTKYGKLDDSITDIAVQASVAAIESAGIKPKEIDAGYISNVFGIADKQVHLGPVIMSNLGISEKPSLSIESACGSGSVSFREALQMLQLDFMMQYWLLVLKRLHIQEQSGQQLIFHIVQIFFMKDKLVHLFLVYLPPWHAHI